MAGSVNKVILVGNHRYRCQEMNESGFRSYFREHAPGFTLLEPLGVTAHIVPWNFPLQLAVWKVAPALALPIQGYLTAALAGLIETPLRGPVKPKR
jgi:hypothetical protein